MNRKKIKAENDALCTRTTRDKQNSTTETFKAATVLKHDSIQRNVAPVFSHVIQLFFFIVQILSRPVNLRSGGLNTIMH
jgi:hypothetical protein